MTALKVLLIILAALLGVAGFVAFIISIWAIDERWLMTGVVFMLAALVSGGTGSIMRQSGW